MYSDLDRPPLDARFLTSRLCKPGSLWTAIEVLPETGSTNAVVADRARAGADEGLVVIAEHQTAGRGRLDRTWTAPPRSALLFSVLLRPATIPAAHWPWLGLLAPLAVATAVRRTAELPGTVKWPNDVLVDDRKLAGILLERVDSAAVVGIGLNVTLRRPELPRPDATSLSLEGAETTDRATVLAAVLRQFERHYVTWRRSGGDPAAIRTEYTELSATLGREVRAELPDGTTVTGTATGLDADGRLLLESPDGTHAFAAADITHLHARR